MFKGITSLSRPGGHLPPAAPSIRPHPGRAEGRPRMESWRERQAGRGSCLGFPLCAFFTARGVKGGGVMG